MSGFILSPRAKADLDEIWTHSAREWSVERAERYLRAIQSALIRLSEAPQIALGCDDIREGYRKYNIGSHVVFFRMQRDQIAIMRILHQRMDVNRHMP